MVRGQIPRSGLLVGWYLLISMRRPLWRQLTQDVQHQGRWQKLAEGEIHDVQQRMVHDVQVCILLINGSPGHDDSPESEAGGADCSDKANLSQLLPPPATLDWESACQTPNCLTMMVRSCWHGFSSSLIQSGKGDTDAALWA